MTTIIPDPFEKEKKMVLPKVRRHRDLEAARDRRIEELESDTLFLGLLGRALLKVLNDRGICSREEIIDAMQKVDWLDGKLDHGLAPAEVAEELGVDMPERDRKKEFTNRLKGESRG